MTTTEPRPAAAAPDAAEGDAIAALEEERDFLLRSLDDLEREHDAGDVDDHDYETLRDDYTARAALAIRSIEAKQAAAEPPRAPRRWGRTIAWVAAIAVFGVLAGVLVAHMSGARQGNDTATGSVRDDTRQLLADALDASRQGKYDDAIRLYDKALELSPSNAEALTYRGWARFQSKEDDAASMADVDAAIAADPTYPDPHVFKASMLVEAGDFSGAAAELRTIDSLNPPSIMRDVIAGQKLRERIIAGVLFADGAPKFTDAGFSADDVLATARYSFPSVPVQALGLIDQVLAVDPNDADAHADRGFMLAQVSRSTTGQEDLRDRGLAEINAALAIDPANAPALAYKAIVLFYLYDDEAGAKAALAQYDAGTVKPAYVEQLLDQSTDLRPQSGG